LFPSGAHSTQQKTLQEIGKGRYLRIAISLLLLLQLHARNSLPDKRPTNAMIIDFQPADLLDAKALRGWQTTMTCTPTLTATQYNAK
jgi:hypothetical protein